MLKFVVVLVATTLICDAAILKESCATPGVTEGLCVKLRECPSICSMSKDFDTPMTIERLNYLIDSMCGYEDKSPKVCCPIEEVTMPKVEETTNSEITETTSMLVREEMTSSSEIRDETTTLGQSGEEMTSANEISQD